MRHEPDLVLRWHVARLHVPSPSDQDADRSLPEVWVELVVAMASDELPKDLAGGTRPRAGLVEELAWWRADDDDLLHGWSTEEALLRALRESTSLDARAVTDVPRRITEDMVFVQSGIEGTALYECHERARAGELPDLSSLIERSASWWDFTKPARRMAKATYQRALRDAEDDDLRTPRQRR